MDTEILDDPQIDLPIVIFDGIASIDPDRATEVFENCGVVFVDNLPIDWPWVLTDREKRQIKKLDEMPKRTLTDDEKEIYSASVSMIREVKAACFPRYNFYREDKSSRLLIVEREFMHFDTFKIKPDSHCVTGILNVDDRPRLWELTWNFPLIIKALPKMMRGAYTAHKTHGTNISHRIRPEMQTDQFSKVAPIYNVKLAPKSVLFCNAKTVSHRIVYGGGGVMLASRTKDARCQSQENMLEEAFGK